MGGRGDFHHGGPVDSAIAGKCRPMGCSRGRRHCSGHAARPRHHSLGGVSASVGIQTFTANQYHIPHGHSLGRPARRCYPGVLALSVLAAPFIAEEVKRGVGIAATGYVLVVLVLQGQTLRPLISRLDRLTPVDEALSRQVVALAR